MCMFYAADPSWVGETVEDLWWLVWGRKLVVAMSPVRAVRVFKGRHA